MHPKLTEFVGILENRIERTKEKESTLYFLDEVLSSPTITATEVNMHIDSWGDLTVLIYVKHVKDIAPTLTTLCMWFERPSTKVVDINKAVFNYYFHHKYDKEGISFDNGFCVAFHLDGNASCKLVERTRYKESVEKVEYELVCLNGVGHKLSSEEIAELTLDQEEENVCS